MTVYERFENMEVNKGYHFCMFCDSEADFVISDTNVSPKMQFPMCNSCAELFKSKIEVGMSI